MRSTANERIVDFLTRHGTLVMFILLLCIFGLNAPAFLGTDSLGNIVKQASFIGIAAIGMVFVLLTAGIDLSVGSAMYLGPLIAGFAMRDMGAGVAGGVVTAILAGMVIGGINAFCIVVLRIIPFIVTLSTLFFFRGFGAWVTSSRQFDFPDEIRAFGLATVLGIPMPILFFVAVAVLAHIVLSRTTFGRQIYAFGNDPEAARKAGINTRRIQASVYVICSTCASLAGFVLIAQIGRLDAGFGEGREFDVIAAAVLGGASLFGGIGTMWSAVIGATMIQAVKAGLVFTGINLYLQPILQGLIIFVAVFFDSLRELRLAALKKRFIRPLSS